MITDSLRQEHERLQPHVQHLRDLADAVGEVPSEDLRAGLEKALDFVSRQLLPHAEAEDRVLYPAVARLMGASLATRTMSRDHLAVFRMGDKMRVLLTALQDHAPDPLALKALRRVLYGLYAVVKLHLAKEESVYWPLIESRLNAREMDELLRAMQAADAQSGHPARKTPPLATP